MNGKIDPKIIKIEPEGESEVTSFLISQRYLCVNNDIKEENCYDNTNQFENVVGHGEEDSSPNCLNGTLTNDPKEEVDYSSGNGFVNNKFENVESVREEDSNGSCVNPIDMKYEDGTIINEDKFNYKCEQCEYSTNQENNLRRHASKHIIYKCEECNYSTYRIKRLVAHYVTHQNIYKCGFATRWKTSLKAHSAKHNGVVYKCEQCDYSTRCKTSFSRHFAKHQGIIYKCHQCDYFTYRKPNLVLHCRKHQGVYYKCEQCDFLTYLKQNLDRHSLTHTRIVYKCNYCDYVTYRKIDLRPHIDVMHRSDHFTKYKTNKTPL